MTTIDIQPADDQWLGFEELSQILGKSIGTLHNARSRGHDLPPSYKFGKSVRYRRSDVNRWLEQHRHIPSSVQLQQAAE